MENTIRGYKAFNADFTNHYGQQFDVDQVSTVDGNAVFGVYGNGYHFCKRLEDTLRYFDAMNGEVLFAEVIGSGDVREGFDEYYGYYDMYAATNLEIVRLLDRKEIIDMFSDEVPYRVIRFIQGFRLTEEEREYYKAQYANEYKILQAIAYYQEGDKGAYSDENGLKFLRKFKTENVD